MVFLSLLLVEVFATVWAYDIREIGDTSKPSKVHELRICALEYEKSRCSRVIFSTTRTESSEGVIAFESIRVMPVNAQDSLEILGVRRGICIVSESLPSNTQRE